MSGFMSFGIDKGDTQVKSTERSFKGKKGETNRLSMAWWEITEDGKLLMSADTPEFVGASRFYIEGVGYVLNKGPQYAALAPKSPRVAIGTIVVVWPTNTEGTLIKEKFAAGEFKVLPWIFSKDKYNALARKHREWPFGEHDLKVTCTDAKFQKMEFDSCKDNLLAKIFQGDKPKMIELQQVIIGRIQELAGTIEGEVARDWNLDELKSKIRGEDAPSPVTGNNAVATDQLDDLIEGALDDL